MQRANRAQRGRARDLRPEPDPLRAPAQDVLGKSRPDPGHAPGQRRRHAISFRDLHVRSGAARGRGGFENRLHQGAPGQRLRTGHHRDPRRAAVVFRRGLSSAISRQEPDGLLRARRHRRELPGRHRGSRGINLDPDDIGRDQSIAAGTSFVVRFPARIFPQGTGGNAMTASADAPQVNVPALIDEQKISAFQIRVAVLCAAVVFMDGFDAQAIGYVAPTLSKAWSLAPGELKWTFSAGLVGLMLGALVFSPLADRIGRKPVIVFCTLWFGIASLLTVTAESTTSLLVWRFITGLGLGGIFPLLLAPILIFWLPESIRLLALKGTRNEYVAGLIRAINPALRLAPGTRFIAPEERPEGFPVEHL